MKKNTLILTSLFLILSLSSFSATEWPREISNDKGARIIMYQPQPESLKGNKMVARSVVSVQKSKDEDLVFGVVWTETTLLTDKDTRMATMESIKVTRVKFPDIEDKSRIDAFSSLLENEIPKWNLEIPIDEIVATLEQDQPVNTDEFNTAAPEVIYRNEPTTLILIDGEPKIKMDDQMKAERVLNTPFLIVKNPDDSKYYLYAGSFWYVSASVTDGWSAAKSLSPSIKKIDNEIKKNDKENRSQGESAETLSPTAILVKTKPAELIQTKGEASFASVQGTGLLYITNTEDEIFRSVDDQLYYILLSGRWYKSSALKGPWEYVSSDKLPADFGKIPEGSDKDVVLPFVAGTTAAREAVMDAQIPQTAKVDRNSTECTVKYDGEPKFEPIEGTGLQVAVNTSSTVLISNNKYYAVENGVWFISDKPAGPWKVSTDRPSEVDRIPPENQAYNVKYVYIYETTPQYVYVGYTPGYMGCYIYGPTVIYGTGFYYNPWYGPWYYPRPVTYGFGMHYNPWTGWSMSFGFSTGYFHYSYRYYGYGGWWGPPVYRPPYHPGHGHHYGPRPVHYANSNINRNNSNNIYNNRRDVQTRDLNRRPDKSNPAGRPSASTRDVQSSRPSTRDKVSSQPVNKGTSSTDRTAPDRNNPSANPANRASNNVYSDRAGNVYKRESNGEWQQRNQGTWQPPSNNRQPSPPQVDRSSQMRDRGNMRSEQAATYNGPQGTVSQGQKGIRTEGSGRRR